MSDFKSYKQQSRDFEWGNTQEGVLTQEQIKLGCILRIADATEAMAKEHNRLIAENKQLRESRDYYLNDNHELCKTRTALKGQVTKLKNKLEAKEKHKKHLLERDHSEAILFNDYGHVPLEPARQYCKHCNACLYTQEYKQPCTNFNSVCKEKQP